MSKLRIIELLCHEFGYKLEGWQKRILLLEFPDRLPRKEKKRRKKLGMWYK